MKRVLVEKLHSMSISQLLELCSQLNTGIVGYKTKNGLIDHLKNTFDQLKMFSNSDIVTGSKKFSCYNRCISIENTINTYKRLCKLSERNRLQVELIKSSGLECLEWIRKYAIKFVVIYENGEFDIEVIKKMLYEERV